MKALLALLLHGTIVRAAGTVAATLLVWFIGPLVAIGSAKPLEEERTRWIVIGILVAWFVIALAWRLVRDALHSRQFMGGLAAPADPSSAVAPNAGDAEVALLGRRFEEALSVLKAARKASGKGGLTDYLNARHFVYELPWFVMIGAPGAGKTTALVNSGLDFPLTDKLGQAAVRGVGGTRNCDWWFTHDAVLLDTAGRYTTQDSDQNNDRAAWTGFLGLLKRYRPRRPINGVIVALSVPELIDSTEAAREHLAAHLRSRLQELHEHLGIRFPVYTLVTKTDLLPGFFEMFGTAGRDERAQVFGTTFDFDGDIGRYQPLAQLPAELAALGRSLGARLLQRMQAEPDRDRRALVYAFPQQWHALNARLDDMLTRIFHAGPFEEKALLRGVYYTSGTQEGSPLDRLFGNTARALGLPARPGVTAQHSTGKSFFITKLLTEVVFGEASLAGTNLRWERRQSMILTGIRIGCIALTVALMAGWWVSYGNNRSYVDHVAHRVDAVERQVDTLQKADATDIVGILPVVAAVRDLASTSEFGARHAPEHLSFGLFQGDKLGAATQDAYLHLLRDAFLPRLVERIEVRLREAAHHDPDMAWEDLKAYLMLHEAAHFDADALRAYFYADWERSLDRKTSHADRLALAEHLDRLLAAGDLADELTPDRKLVDATRLTLGRTPVAQRVWNRLKRLGIAHDIPEFNIPRAAGPAAALVLARADGASLSAGVPGLYTYAGYHKAFLPAMREAATQFSRESPWVLGVSLTGAGGTSVEQQVADTVERIYLNEYATHWESFIGTLRLRHTASLRETIELAQFASAPDSPLVALFQAIVQEVTLAREPVAEPKPVVAQAADRLRGKIDELKRLAQSSPANAPVTAPHALAAHLVDARFDGLRRLFSAPAGQPAPVQGALNLVGDLYTMLLAADTALKSRATPPASDVPIRVAAEAGRLPDPLRGMLTQLAQAGTGQALDRTRTHLGQEVRATLTDFCGRAIAGRYPVTRSSGLDVTQADFGRFFAPGGMLDAFFQKHLAAYVDTGVTPWALRKQGDATMGGPSAALPQFQRAQRIRGAFFGQGSATPTLRMTFRPLDLDRAITQVTLDVDGQTIRYSHGPQVPVPVLWPGPRGTGQVRLSIEPPAVSGRSGLLYEGPWALLRLMDAASLERGAQPERVVATFDVDGRSARFEVVASGVDSPFGLPDLAQFRCPEGL